MAKSDLAQIWAHRQASGGCSSIDCEQRTDNKLAKSEPEETDAFALVTAAVVLLLAGSVALWAHYGTAVFYETILAGIAACF